MDANILRVVKIDKEALYEFIYENFIAQQEELLDISKSEVMNDFAIDWEKGEFLFTAHRQENMAGELISLPQGVNTKSLLENLPVTTDSVLKPNQIYKDYSFEDLSKFI